MQTSSLVVDKVQELAAAGHHAEVVEYLGSRERTELEDSPSLALVYGTAHAHLGRPEEGMRWLDVALDQARKKDDPMVECRALNARGATALVSGRVDEAADYLTQALMVASRAGDLATTGRCSNNLGVISSLRGRHAEAIGSWEIAVAAFDRAGSRQGVAECCHNLGISYREQGALDRALVEADRAVAEAEAAGDRTLWALALRGRAEIRVLLGELELARLELDQVREIRRQLPHPADEAEDLRVAASVLGAEGQTAAAEHALREVIGRAEAHRRPQLRAEAMRDLAKLLRRMGRPAEAQAAARAAKDIFTALGAEGEIRDLAGDAWDNEFAAELGRSLAPLHEAQALADSGHYDELVTYLSGRPQSEVEQSPMLALLYGIGHGRLGRLGVGQGWALAALSRARVLGDRPLELRALNVCGAIALERGGISEATLFFARAQERAMEDDDMAAVGRCANNLGIIANMQGDHGRAIGAYTRAIAAYQNARYDRGIAEARHNLGITYREQGRLDDAMQAADAAVRDADRLGDRWLKGLALAGRAEIQIVRGEPELAVRESERALAIHRELKNVVRDAERELPLYVAVTQRNLARTMARAGEVAAAKQAAQTARAAFERLGAMVEVEKLDALLGEPGSRDA